MFYGGFNVKPSRPESVACVLFHTSEREEAQAIRMQDMSR